ncbi:hypothetical protein ACSSNL_15025 [Thalassobius sp. S69A]|uniref:hypothetical protein n=1 Tax=unclassified Thalassovita TaxID=2619711 RepID=UPI003C7D200E
MPNRIDKPFLLRSGIAGAFEIRPGLTMFQTNNEDAPWGLKFFTLGASNTRKSRDQMLTV